MTSRSWYLGRRTFLVGTGCALGLPFLECMASQDSMTARPKRFCGVYFPYGIANQKPDSEYANWNWFPASPGHDYVFSDALRPLQSHRDSLSILGGLSHPHGRSMGGHDTADIWLTAAELKGSGLRNSVSIDQVMAATHGHQTRYASLVLSSDGGVGEPTRSSTLSYGLNGQPIPAVHQPRIVFDNLFGVNTASVESQRQQLGNSQQMLDRVLENARSLRRRLGEQDQHKFDEYLQSVRDIEVRVQRSERWLEVPKPEVDGGGLHLDADDTTPRELIQTMFDLVVLALQTDSTRYVTYQIGNMNGATSIAGKFPQLLGLADNMHALAHGANRGDGGEKKGRWDQFLAGQLAYLIDRLKNTADGNSNLLDQTVVLYGSSNSNTHLNENYPLIVAGGTALGFRHGAYHQLSDSVPMSNLLLTIMHRLDTPLPQFVDSTAELAEIVH